MLHALETGIGLDMVIWLQSYRTPLLDAVVRALHILGSTAGFVVVGLLIFWRLDRRFAAFWLFTIIVTSFATDLIKVLVAAPRPFQVAPELVTALVEQHNYGLPSGHVSHMLSAFGLFAIVFRYGWLWLLVGIMTLLMAWSRVYAGVHYPQDVLAGVIVGALSLWFAARYFDFFTRLWGRYPPLVRWPLAAVVIILIILL